MKQVPATWLDRAIGWVSPNSQLERMRARGALSIMARYYEAGDQSRRTQGWKRPAGDPNASTGVSLGRLRDSAHHLIRNNGHALSGKRVIVDDVVGWGIQAAATHEAWKRWTGDCEIDADGRCDLAGIEQTVMGTVVESGECLVRRRWRRPSDGLSIPLQIQLLEPDFIDSSKHQMLPSGGRIVRGVEFDAIGKRAAYWLFREHPGASVFQTSMRLGQTVRVPASEVLHIFWQERPGQVRGASWYSPVLIRFNDYDEYADATLMKQKIAACLAVLTTDPDGSVGTPDPNDPMIEQLEPGGILKMAPGRNVTVVDPPTVRDYADYSRATLQEIGAGLGVTPEDLTGDYSQMNFSSARMSRLRHWARVEGWRWRMLAPQFLNPLWRWAMQGAALAGLPVVERTAWTAPPLPMIEPDKEGLAIQRNIRTGISTPSEELRARGYVPEQFWDEYQEDFEDLDRRGLVIDSDARKMTQGGQLHSASAPAPASEEEHEKAPPPRRKNGKAIGAISGECAT